MLFLIFDIKKSPARIGELGPRLESAKDELEAQNLPQAETVAKASELLQEVVEKISEVLEDKKHSGQQSSQ